MRPGEKVATDGVVVRGSSAVDRSMLTGESLPEDVRPGDEVTGATINTGGRLVVRATRVGADTELARMSKLVTEAQNGKAQVQRLADRISSIFVPVVLVVAALTLVGWLLAGWLLAGWLLGGQAAGFAVTAAVTVLVVACPCALGLATPTALMVGTGRGARLGLLVKGPEVLESTRRVDVVVLDKTGTVTTGAMSVTDVVPATGHTREDVLRTSGALEAASEHPIARTIADTARTEVGSLPEAEDFHNAEGLGVTGTVDSVPALVGRAQLLEEHSVALPAELADAKRDAERAGRTVVAVAADGRAAGLVVVADQIKPSSPRAVEQLRALGLRPMLLTGDNAQVAESPIGPSPKCLERVEKNSRYRAFGNAVQYSTTSSWWTIWPRKLRRSGNFKGPGRGLRSFESTRSILSMQSVLLKRRFCSSSSGLPQFLCVQ